MRSRSQQQLSKYEERRNALIPEADAMARKRLAVEDRTEWSHTVIKGVYGSKCSYNFYSRYFHDAMNQLSLKYNLVDFGQTS